MLKAEAEKMEVGEQKDVEVEPKYVEYVQFLRAHQEL